jgi:osmoprotectant transport system ATP-binding protein
MTTPDSSTSPSIMIRLEELSKHYPSQPAAAVESLTLDIPEGEIVILVGPSGCGKTTTMKMINRIIEPTSGRIILDGEDVTRSDPNLLRRRIGYVIQQVGLFPHMTIAENIATVPKLLGWDKKRIDARIDELLETVNMAPGQYRNRYPKDLSGGQLQRVGVARGLSGDPAVMLMDEPFGAIDPITRERLQNEFLRLQSEYRKTIVFVTHDIDEAIKMGDRIAILTEGSRIAQYGTPEEILTAPANDFVADFIGSGASLKRLKLSRVGDIEVTQWATVAESASPSEARGVLEASAHDALLVLDESGRPRRWVDAVAIAGAGGRDLEGIGQVVDSTIDARTTLSDALNEIVTAPGGVAVVVDERGVHQGVVDISVINRAGRGMRARQGGPVEPAVSRAGAGSVADRP